VSTRERASARATESQCVFGVCEKESTRMTDRKRERETERQRKKESESVCKREREKVCVRERERAAERKGFKKRDTSHSH